MKKISFKNIITVITAFLILTSGSFSFALLHNSCSVNGDVHIKCLNDCCSEDACNEEISIYTDSELFKTDSCCEIHPDLTLQTGPFVIINSGKKINSSDLILNYTNFRLFNAFQNSAYSQVPVRHSHNHVQLTILRI